jgi:hypothetical protein
MVPVPTFDETLISTKDMYQHFRLSTGNASSQIIKPQLATVTRNAKVKYGKTLNVAKRLKFLANSFKKSRQRPQTFNKRAIKT